MFAKRSFKLLSSGIGNLYQNLLKTNFISLILALRKSSTFLKTLNSSIESLPQREAAFYKHKQLKWTAGHFKVSNQISQCINVIGYCLESCRSSCECLDGHGIRKGSQNCFLVT